MDDDDDDDDLSGFLLDLISVSASGVSRNVDRGEGAKSGHGNIGEGIEREESGEGDPLS